MSTFEIVLISALVVIALPSLCAFLVWAATMTVAAALWVVVFGGLAYIYPPFWQGCVVMVLLVIAQHLWERFHRDSEQKSA